MAETVSMKHPAEPVVSVILPTYNCASTLKRALTSIQGQTFSDIEVLIAFDHSTDGTDEVVRECAHNDARVKIIPNPGKKMLSCALNAALKAARGEFVARMDADDIAVADRLERQVTFMRAHPDVAICGMAAVIIDEEGREIDRFLPVCGPERLRISAEYAPPLFHPTWFSRRECLNTLNGYREIPNCEDYDLLLRALDAGMQLDNLPEIGLYYWRRPSHRASIVNHKATQYVYALHGRRQRRLPEGFSQEAFAVAVGGRRLNFRERLSQNLMAWGFERSERGNVVGIGALVVGLALSPVSASLAWRKFATTLKLKFST